ncbi:Transcription factor HES-7.1-A HES-related protein 1-A [Triplophysa tibetana]|uniref:Transcription factor HES-7.1-A HES-related protein 1-A n=1 Tax=Triplophysa tibetana TaxID=1572043 RepID=A0A5A9P2R4_9TELE|nr:Transcription factor HES-7.1-A HES-related protein 1-A [Triplophysa tibetana]
MKILGETEHIKMDRKLLKPQVERRRRERMNRSLENLRALLLQGPEHTNPNQRRIEKAEILEYTVLFLQNSAAKNAKDEEEKEKCKFMDGFSTCLEKAAGFLSEEGEARGFQGSVTATLCQRLKQPCVPAHIRMPVKLQNSSRMKVPESHAQQHHRRQTPACKQGLSAAFRNIVLHHNRFPHRSTEPNMPQCHENTHSAARPTSQLQAPVIQPMWRPWP